MPSASMRRCTRSASPSAAICGSVTRRTLPTPSRLSSQPASLTAPGPNLTGVASSVNTVSVAMGETLLRALAEVVGERHAFDDPDLTAGFETDWTGRFTGRARVVVRPGSTEEVAGVVARCAEAGAAIVPQGGNS